ncbi:MAG TPA: efflux RND transporter periplasmic adaptor subunit [Gaiellaceae bacterium]|nr:efflux RND transporter periplasmic adaptor subunit [Gaiellaceae bacterium]
MTRHALLSARALILGFGALAAAGGAFLAVDGLHPTRAAPSSSTATATAVRGDVRATVGGLGRVVVAGQGTSLNVPAGASASSATSTTPPSGQTAAPPGAVFATAAGHIGRYLVAPGQRVAPGQPIAVLDDGGTAATAEQQARGDLASARLELAQKQVSDPTKGVPPTQVELRAANLAIAAARERLGQLVHPTRADVLAAQLDIRKATADLDTLTRNVPPAALSAARAAIDAATVKLAQVSGLPTQVELTAAQLELAKAQAEIDALKATPPGVSATALAAAQFAVTLATQKLAEVPVSAPQSEKLQAQYELKKAQADLDTLQKPAPTASAGAIAAAQTAVDLATQKLAQLNGPPNPATVAAARTELEKARADLATLARKPLAVALDVARLGVSLANQKLRQVLHPTRAARDTVRLDVVNALAARTTLQRRGGPATPAELGIARLKADTAASRLTLTQAQVGRLTVRAPFAGTVTTLLGSPGSPTDLTTPIATVADLQHLAVNVDLSEFDVARVRAGLPALVSVDALGGKRLPGVVEFMALAGVDNGGVVTFPVRVGLRTSTGVKPGMNVSVKIVAQARRNVVIVPLEAVQHDAGQPTVTVVRRDGTTVTRPVRLGLADNKQVEIRTGVRPGERIALGGGPSGP